MTRNTKISFMNDRAPCFHARGCGFEWSLKSTTVFSNQEQGRASEAFSYCSVSSLGLWLHTASLEVNMLKHGQMNVPG